MKSLFTLLLICTPSTLFAAEKHVHGAAELSIAFQGTEGKIEFTAANDSLFGFEHAARTAADKKTAKDALEKLEKQIGEMISFDPILNCKITKEKFEIHAEAKNHSNTEASFAVKCDKPLAGSTMKFQFQKHFPRLQQIDAQILVDHLQKSLKIKASGNLLELK